MRVLDDWLLTPYRAAVHLPTRTLVAADLHLGYLAARRSAGESVPTDDLAAELAPLQKACQAVGVTRLLVAGDLFEAGPRDGLAHQLWKWCSNAGLELVGVVPGNHDRGLIDAPGPLPIFAGGVLLGDWRVVHGDGPPAPGRTVQGHEHPCLRWNDRVGGPCYLFDDQRLVLPAYSTETVGVNVRHDPRWAAFRCAVIAGDQVLDFGKLSDLPGSRRS